MTLFERDGRVEDLANALFFAGFMRLNSGHIMLEAEDNGTGFEWTKGATVFYSPAKTFLLDVGLWYERLPAESAIISSDAVPVSVLHEAEHSYAFPNKEQGGQ